MFEELQIQIETDSSQEICLEVGIFLLNFEGDSILLLSSVQKFFSMEEGKELEIRSLEDDFDTSVRTCFLCTSQRGSDFHMDFQPYEVKIIVGEGLHFLNKKHRDLYCI